MDWWRLALLTFLSAVRQCDGFLAAVDLELVRFRVLDGDSGAGGTRCDTDSFINRYNPCDLVFYVKNCSQLPRNGVSECSVRIDRFYAPENTDDVTFREGSRPTTSLLVDNILRDTIIKVDVFDQDDNYSEDDPVGAYQLRVSPDTIDSRGLSFATFTEQAILIPDHSELTVRYRAYCVDEECRSRRASLEQGSQFQSGQSHQQPSEAWMISANGKGPSTWDGQTKPAVAQSIGPGWGSAPPHTNHASQPVDNRWPASAQRPEAPLGGQWPWRPQAPVLQPMPAAGPQSLPMTGPSQSLPVSGFTGDAAAGQGQAPHVLGFYCENGRCFTDNQNLVPQFEQLLPIRGEEFHQGQPAPNALNNQLEHGQSAQSQSGTIGQNAPLPQGHSDEGAGRSGQQQTGDHWRGNVPFQLGQSVDQRQNEHRSEAIRQPQFPHPQPMLFPAASQGNLSGKDDVSMVGPSQSDNSSITMRASIQILPEPAERP